MSAIVKAVKLAGWSVGAFFVLLFGFIAFGTSCQRRYQDVSKEAKHSEWVGQECVVVNGLIGYGFTGLDGNHGLGLTTPPGVGGREITFKLPVPKGTKLQVSSVRECWNCPFDRIDYGFRIEGIPRLERDEVFAFPHVLVPEELSCTKVAGPNGR